jgi:hypothetical protein
MAFSLFLSPWQDPKQSPPLAVTVSLLLLNLFANGKTSGKRGEEVRMFSDPSSNNDMKIFWLEGDGDKRIWSYGSELLYEEFCIGAASWPGR